MKIYLDNCCLNRPFDNQNQPRIHLETEAILLIMQKIIQGEYFWAKSVILDMEIDKIPNLKKKERIIPLMKCKLLYNGNYRKEVLSVQTIQARDRRKCRAFEETVQTRKASENKRKGADVISI